MKSHSLTLRAETGGGMRKKPQGSGMTESDRAITKGTGSWTQDPFAPSFQPMEARALCL
jgi:hypothetical protein